MAAAGSLKNNTNIKVIFKICAPFTICIREINNTQVDGAQDIDIVTVVDPEILKGEGLKVGHHGWLTKKILGFRWSKKARIMLETISFG